MSCMEDNSLETIRQNSIKSDMVPVYWWLLMNTMPKLGFDLFGPLSGILMALGHH